MPTAQADAGGVSKRVVSLLVCLLFWCPEAFAAVTHSTYIGVVKSSQLPAVPEGAAHGPNGWMTTFRLVNRSDELTRLVHPSIVFKKNETGEELWSLQQVKNMSLADEGNIFHEFLTKTLKPGCAVEIKTTSSLDAKDQITSITILDNQHHNELLNVFPIDRGNNGFGAYAISFEALYCGRVIDVQTRKYSRMDDDTYELATTPDGYGKLIVHAPLILLGFWNHDGGGAPIFDTLGAIIPDAPHGLPDQCATSVPGAPEGSSCKDEFVEEATLLREYYDQGSVVEHGVIDGDTLVARVDDREWQVRLINIDTPELSVYDGNGPGESAGVRKYYALPPCNPPSGNTPGMNDQFGVALGRQAKEYVKNRLAGQQRVWLRRDPNGANTDMHKRLLRYVYLQDPCRADSISLNEELLAQGLARYLPGQWQEGGYFAFPERMYGQRFRESEARARTSRTGFWAHWAKVQGGQGALTADGLCPQP